MVKVKRPMLWDRFEAGVAALHGEVDISTCELFANAVESATRHAAARLPPSGEVHLDLGGVQFIDVCGARVLVKAAAKRQPGHEIVLHRPSALLVRILELGWGQVRGLKLGACRDASASTNGNGVPLPAVQRALAYRGGRA